MPANKKKKERVRALLAKAHVEIGARPVPTDRVKLNDIAETGIAAAEPTRRFFNTNDSCSVSEPGVPDVHMPEFNTNGSCLTDASALDVEKGLALVKALRNALR